MRTIFIFILVSLAWAGCNSIANSKTETFKVYGNCGMCKKTIEKSLAADDIKADWNKKTKMITVTYDSVKYSSQKIHEMIAASGYDTELVRGSDSAYDKLHECCKYERRK